MHMLDDDLQLCISKLRSSLYDLGDLLCASAPFAYLALLACSGAAAAAFAAALA